MNDLDRLLEQARAAEPDPLDDATVEAWVRDARVAASRETAAEDHAESPLDRLLAEARGAEPEPLDELAVRRMAQRAAMTGGARHNTWTRRRLMFAAGAAAALAAAAVTLSVLPDSTAPTRTAAPVPRPTAPEPSEPTDLELPTGDRIVAAAGARFGVEMARPEERRVRLSGGSMLFDVCSLEGGRFSVNTPNAEVLVLGTVFTVHATDEGTTVRVYEGRVQVRGHDEERVVHAGGMVHVGGGEPRSDSLAREGREAARERGLAQATPTPEPVADRSAVRSERRPSVAPRPAPQREAQAPVEVPVEAADVRLWIARGDAARGLEEARRQTGRGRVDPWRMLEGDALRALGRHAEAADVYRRATVELSPPRRQQAGFLEARLRASELDDPAGALRALRDAEVSGAGSPLRERGLALEAQLLTRLGRHAEVREIAESYLADYPEGSQAEQMRGRL